MGLPDTIGQQPRQPMPGGPPRERGPRPGGPGEPRPRQGGKPMGQKNAPTPKQPAPPKPKREKIPPPEPFKPTEEQIAQVEARYKELAVPAEYDGIRTQIAQELSIPKSAVKKIVKDFRDKEHIPSWWELQTYKGNAEELEQIKAVYVPFLPVPAIGVHKQIAEQLSLKPVDVYQAIKALRQEMKLPQYNDPALHGLEPILPDGKVGGFGREAVPLLKQNDYAGALLLMTSRVADVIAKDAGVELTGARPEAPVQEEPSPRPSASRILWIIIIILIVLFTPLRRFVFWWLLLGRRGGGWGSGGGWGGGGGFGGGGGGFGGFGGGSSGGGGASGSW